MNALYAFDAEQLQSRQWLCGVDEAGRGPLCGPVAIGAVILDLNDPIEGIRDSKKLSEKKRELLYEEITRRAVAWHVELVPPETIDSMNILRATLWGMAQAVAALSPPPELVLVDGNQLPELALPCKPVVKGDAVSASIAAASILAKVTRDRHMCELARQYPQYRLDKHKGYPTKEHYALLEEHGVLPFYRRSFLKKRGLG